MSLFNSGVRPVIDAHLLAEAAKKRDYGDYWSASSAGYCMRKLVFERLGVPSTQPDDPRKQRVFSAGHIFHDWLQELTRKAGVSIAQELELQDEELMIRGHFDDLVLITTNGYSLKAEGEDELVIGGQHLILYDYKTVNSRSFLWAKKNGNAMSHYHKMQLGTYMYMLRKTDEAKIHKPIPGIAIWDVKEARILKIEKENLMMMEQQLLWTPELEAEVLGYWNRLNEYWTGRTIPPCTCGDHEGGFMAKEKFNLFYYEGEPCSLAYYLKWKEKQ